mmetsp:Transcript_36780/g.74280  ORF Transcript_36780/g.74280 Transcript_36780/m.74280 type:complete len:221 (-) Transcript_36780:371-1033(-)
MLSLMSGASGWGKAATGSSSGLALPRIPAIIRSRYVSPTWFGLAFLTPLAASSSVSGVHLPSSTRKSVLALMMPYVFLHSMSAARYAKTLTSSLIMHRPVEESSQMMPKEFQERKKMKRRSRMREYTMLFSVVRTSPNCLRAAPKIMYAQYSSKKKKAYDRKNWTQRIWSSNVTDAPMPNTVRISAAAITMCLQDIPHSLRSYSPTTWKSMIGHVMSHEQ